MHVSLLAYVGVSVREAQKRVGHSNPMMTLQTYTHVMDGAERRIAGKLDELLGGCAAPSSEERGTIQPAQSRTGTARGRTKHVSNAKRRTAKKRGG